MKLTNIKQALEQIKEINFKLPDHTRIPSHFHVTEVGKIDKHFIDCGGTIRREAVISFQLYTAQDYDHRLSVSKLKKIIELSEKQLGLDDLEVEVEYQGSTIGKYGLDFDGQDFILLNTQTDCLAKDECGIPTDKKLNKNLATHTVSAEASCTPGSGCC